MDLIGSSVHRVIGSSVDPRSSRILHHEQSENELSRNEVVVRTPAAIELHIEELVLHGFPATDRFRIGDAVEQELSRLITEQGLGVAANPANMERLDAGAFKVEASARPRTIGTQLANSVYQGLTVKPKRGNKTSKR